MKQHIYFADSPELRANRIANYYWNTRIPHRVIIGNEGTVRYMVIRIGRHSRPIIITDNRILFEFLDKEIISMKRLYIDHEIDRTSELMNIVDEFANNRAAHEAREWLKPKLA
jgi:hypothetical protein